LNGKQYLDALAGIAVNTLGHNHPRLVPALQDQLAKLNPHLELLPRALAEQLAAKLVELSGMTNVFFCNTGLEANEAALKLARNTATTAASSGRKSWSTKRLSTGQHRHLSATGNEKVQKGFGPARRRLYPGSASTIWRRSRLLTEGNKNVVAVFFETIQGEGGSTRCASSTCSRCGNCATSASGLLMIDEVQCGMGRTGKWFRAPVGRDQARRNLPLAKGLGSGVPVGAVVAGPRPPASSSPATMHHVRRQFRWRCAPGSRPSGSWKKTASWTTRPVSAPISRGPWRVSWAPSRASPKFAGQGLMIGRRTGQAVRRVDAAGAERGLLISVTGTIVDPLVPALIMTESERRSGLRCWRQLGEGIPGGMTRPCSTISSSAT